MKDFNKRDDIEDKDLDIFTLIRKIKKVDNFNISLMDKDELIEYLVKEMEKIEEKHPKMIEYCNENTDDFDHLI